MPLAFLADIFSISAISTGDLVTNCIGSVIPASISLSQGWNQVGNPYTFNVDLSQAEFSAGAIEPSTYEWTGTSYNTGTQLRPGRGYWVYAYENTSIQLSVIPGTLQRQTEPHSYVEWSGRILASINRMEDTENLFVVSVEERRSSFFSKGTNA